MRYIIRPEHISKTPKALAAALGVQTRAYPNFTSGKADWQQDLFLVYPPTDTVQHHNTAYGRCRSFFSKSKAGQRLALQEAGLPIPKTWISKSEVAAVTHANGQKYVVRPYRHEGGHDYKVTSNPLDFQEGVEYISELWPKDREYRILFVFGTPLVFWQKKPNDGVAADAAWGNENGRYLTITDWNASYLKWHTTAFADIAANPVVKAAHIVAVDILYNEAKKQYVVLEFNVCPSLTRTDVEEPTLTQAGHKVVDAIKAHFQTAQPAQTVATHAQPVVAPVVPPVPQTHPAAAPQLPGMQMQDNPFSVNVIVEKKYVIGIGGQQYNWTKPQIQQAIHQLQSAIA